MRNVIVEIEEWLKKQPPIYLSPKSKVKKAEDVFNLMVKKHRNTYHDKKGLEDQCSGIGKFGYFTNRSFQDILICIKTYFPKYDIKDFFVLVCSALSNKKNRYLSTFYCQDIKKWILCYDKDDMVIQEDRDFMVEQFFVPTAFTVKLKSHQDLFYLAVSRCCESEYQNYLSKKKK